MHSWLLEKAICKYSLPQDCRGKSGSASVNLRSAFGVRKVDGPGTFAVTRLEFNFSIFCIFFNSSFMTMLCNGSFGKIMRNETLRCRGTYSEKLIRAS